MSTITVLQGDNREVLKGLPSCSVDAVVTDPPYGLGAQPDTAAMLRAWLDGREYSSGKTGFMGKAWDAFVPGPAVWRECFRVLKPGGYLLAFFGTRTEDIGSIAIRLAGFERRDMIAWLYGSGFPKSLDVSKAIDAQDATAARRERALRFTAWVRSTGLTSPKIDRITGTQMGSHFTTKREQPAVATSDLFDQLRPYVGEVPEWVEALVRERTVESENLKRREVVGQHADPAHAARWRASMGLGEAGEVGSITTPHTDAARQWEGWQTALKPALEPVAFMQKPLGEGSFAANVLKHGVGALNVDASRVGDDGGTQAVNFTARWAGVGDGKGSRNEIAQLDKGRWPANVVHDGSLEVIAAFPANAGGGVPTAGQSQSTGDVYGQYGTRSTVGHADTGSAARFFYSAKADADGRLGSDHPTVKPVDLMRWLATLVTPPGGVLLDPFAGTGTTGVAALGAGLDAILVELNPVSVADIELRIAHARGEAPHSKALKARNKRKPSDPGPLLAGISDD